MSKAVTKSIFVIICVGLFLSFTVGCDQISGSKEKTFTFKHIECEKTFQRTGESYSIEGNQGKYHLHINKARSGENTMTCPNCGKPFEKYSSIGLVSE